MLDVITHLEMSAAPVCHAEHTPLKPANAEDSAVYQQIEDNFTQGEIATLRKQVEKLTKERDELVGAQLLNRNALRLKDEQLAALAEQNEKLKEATNLIYSWANNWDSEFMNDPDWLEQDYPIIQSTIFLPNLSTPVLNKYRAEGMRVAAEICEHISDEYREREGRRYPELKTDAETGASDCESSIRARADELEKTNG